MSTEVRDAAAREDVDVETVDEDVAPPFETTRRGKLLISAFLAVVLLSLFATNMPDMVIKRDLLTVAQPVLNVTGLDQAWGVFAPNPPRETNLVFARIEHADGTASIVDIPVTSGISEYWTYRWRKYGEQIRRNGDREAERRAFALWAADRDRATGAQPVRVTLVRRAVGLQPPGPGPDETAAREIPFFSTAVTR